METLTLGLPPRYGGTGVMSTIPVRQIGNGAREGSYYADPRPIRQAQIGGVFRRNPLAQTGFCLGVKEHRVIGAKFDGYRIAFAHPLKTAFFDHDFLA